MQACIFKYYLYNGNADMRKGFDSLHGLVSSQMHCDVSSQMHCDVLSGSIFIFINKKRNQLKLLLWEGDGLSLHHKRLEKETYELPAATNTSSATTISAQQLQFILEGISL